VLLTLVRIGVLSYSTLAKARRYMIVINLILGAVLTTPEPITQLVMFFPLQLLYELSVAIAWYWDQPDRAKARRTLFMVFVLILLAIGLVWAGYVYGWPLVRQHWH
jgi:sec-independent protein translocase protein TatC